MIWIKGDMFTYLNAPTGHATAVKQSIIVGHGFNHTCTNMGPHITNIKHAVLDVYPEENILTALTHQQHGHGSRTRVGDGSSPNTKRDWNSGFLNNEEKPFSFRSTHFQGWNGLHEASMPCSPTNIVTSHHLSIATIQRRILLYMTHTTKPDITTCSHCCQSSGWTSVKTTATYHLLRSWPVNPLALQLSYILTG